MLRVVNRYGAGALEENMEALQGRARVNHPYLNDEGCKCIVVRAGRKEDSWIEIASWKRDSHEDIQKDLDHKLRCEGSRIDQLLGEGWMRMDYEGRTIEMRGFNGAGNSAKEIIQKAYPNYTITMG